MEMKKSTRVPKTTQKKQVVKEIIPVINPEVIDEPGIIPVAELPKAENALFVVAQLYTSVNVSINGEIQNIQLSGTEGVFPVFSTALEATKFMQEREITADKLLKLMFGQSSPANENK